MIGDGDNGRPRKRNRPVSDDEATLWHTVTRSVAPLARIRHTLARSLKERGPAAAAQVLIGTGQVTADAAKAKATRSNKPKHSSPPPSAKPLRQPQQPVEFDARTARKVKAGKIDIDARLDLHGLRQSDAHAALKRFLLNAQSAGHRYVKVITGKGKPGDDAAAFDLFSNSERGVLRRMVPLWLAEAEFRPLVVRTTSAGRSQGGDGALIIHVRQVRRER